MKGWTNLGVVDTIYEEEDYDYSSSSSSSSPSLQRNDLSSPSTPLHSRVEEWSLARGSKPDVFVHVRGTSFHLHKDPLSKRSVYLKGHLTGVSNLTLSPPLNITAETFSLVADFCYGAHIQLTPFNVASLRVAAELLLMTETNVDGRENLSQLTESYFRRAVSVSVDYTRVVLRSCLALLPESETTAFLVGRCVEALTLTEDGNGNGVDGFLEDAVRLPAGDFAIVAEAVQRRFPAHDLLYRIVEVYVTERNGEMTEEEKAKICGSIDCGRLSPPLLLHAVQNPKMPLRFIIRAMLQEQLNTRRSIFAAASAGGGRGHRQISAGRGSSVTLGSLLRRDSEAQQAARLRAAMDSTSSRIENLEKELDAMKKLISEESEKQRSDGVGSRSVLDSERSASFHCVFRPSNGKIERGERGSVSLLSTKFRRGGGDGEGAVVPSSFSAGSGRESPKPAKRINGRSIGKKLIKGLKSTFWAPKQGPRKSNSTSDETDDGLEGFVWIKDDDDDDEDLSSR